MTTTSTIPGPGRPVPVCLEPGCKVQHPYRPFVDRPRDTPLARRLAALEPEAVADTRPGPAWLKRLTAKDMTGGIA